MVMHDSDRVLTDEYWAQLQAIIQDIKSEAGAPAETSNRLFVEAVLYRARTGISWRNLPACFGAWDAVYQRFRRWKKRGIWEALAARVTGWAVMAMRPLFADGKVVPAFAAIVAAAEEANRPQAPVVRRPTNLPVKERRPLCQTAVLPTDH